MDNMTLAWIGFNVLVLALLALDLGVFHRTAHEVSIKEAVGWSVVWITLGVSFAGVLLYWWDSIAPGTTYTNQEAALAYITGYFIEKSLAVDNIFVFVLIFSYFAVPAKYQHRVLFWGIIGALLMRGVMIALGAALIAQFHWIIYVFGVFLIFTGIRMLLQRNEHIDPANNPVLRWVRRVMPVTDEYHGDKFFIRRNGIRLATPLFLALVMVEICDLIFAVDSIPAIFAVTQDPFLVYTSNVFAILGLRSLYFVLAGVVHKFHYLKIGLSIVLVFVGTKMLLIETAFKIPTVLSLFVVLAIITGSVIASLLWPPATDEPNPENHTLAQSAD